MGVPGDVVAGPHRDHRGLSWRPLQDLCRRCRAPAAAAGVGGDGGTDPVDRVAGTGPARASGLGGPAAEDEQLGEGGDHLRPPTVHVRTQLALPPTLPLPLHVIE